MNTPVSYPRLLRRVRAVLIDSVLVIILVYAWMVCLPAFGDASHLVKIAALVLPLIAIEPGLVAFTGGTPGHHLMGLRVRDAAEDRNIGLIRAAARAIIRALLGWLSFIFVLVTRRHQALHDYFTSTLVVLRHAEKLPGYERVSARVEDYTRYIYPSRKRRILMILLYALLGFIVLTVLSLLLLSEECLSYDRCSAQESLLVQALSIGWLASLGVTIVLGWRGLLYGCRRSPSRGEAANG